MEAEVPIECNVLLFFLTKGFLRLHDIHVAFTESPNLCSLVIPPEESLSLALVRWAALDPSEWPFYDVDPETAKSSNRSSNRRRRAYGSTFGSIN
ncbi:hypothetical protein NPIL_671211 [Nephila pilipes]|uniref:Uncharacterized protein n=1 Tax=Nephila pilipes TaxID=299642 RepID=A0A8X6P0M6_NEPPI|nr:hypothetical protein NPIL_671211 [Nephila pilipes]